MKDDNSSSDDEEEAASRSEYSSSAAEPQSSQPQADPKNDRMMKEFLDAFNADKE